MDDKIYKILNNTKQEIKNIKSNVLNDEEIDTIMEKFRNEINKDNVPRKRKTRKNVIISAAAAAVLICGGTVATATGLNVFNRQSHANDITFTHTIPDSDETMELPLDKFAVKYNYNDIAKAAQEIEEIKTAETYNLTLQVESVYCDGTTLMIGVSGSMKDGNPKHKQLISLGNIKLSLGNVTYDILYGGEESEFAHLDGSLVLDEGTDNQFSGNITLVVLGDRTITEPETAEISIRTITAGDNYMDQNYIELGSNLNLSVNVYPDSSIKDDNVYTIIDGDYSVRFYEISPVMMIVGFKSPFDEVHSWLNNENGEPVESMSLRELPDYGDRFSIGCMVPVTSGYVTASFFDKNNLDENGNVINIKEIQINMDEVISHLKNNP